MNVEKALWTLNVNGWEVLRGKKLFEGNFIQIPSETILYIQL